MRTGACIGLPDDRGVREETDTTPIIEDIYIVRGISGAEGTCRGEVEEVSVYYPLVIPPIVLSCTDGPGTPAARRTPCILLFTSPCTMPPARVPRASGASTSPMHLPSAMHLPLYADRDKNSHRMHRDMWGRFIRRRHMPPSSAISMQRIEVWHYAG